MPSRGVVTLFGHGIRVCVERGHLVLEDGIGERIALVFRVFGMAFADSLSSAPTAPFRWLRFDG